MSDPDDGTMKTQTLRILVAEDNEVNRKLVMTLVKRWGFEPVVAHNGQEALTVAAENQVDLILMDVQMPVMDGLEATRAIRSWEAKGTRHLPIIALTAHAYASDRAVCLDAGMDEFLTKPVDPLALREAILRLAPPPDARRAGVGTTEDGDPEQSLLDLEDALGRVDGDRELLEEIASLFLETCPGWLEDLRRGLDESNAEQIRRAAHTLKGSASSFGARPLIESALRVEQIGASQDLESAGAAAHELELYVEALAGELRGFLEEGNG
jgi:CheY-like chemotaxis protein/HPt (histidine-containing phosphotransfer) domain-containing protein